MEISSVQAQTSRAVSRRSQIILWTLLVLAGAEFTMRGPARFLQSTDWNDLAQYYTSSRLWLRGQDFTNGDKFTAMWRDQTGISISPKTVRVHFAPPPGALLLFAPLGLLSWRGALLVWLAVLLVSFAVTVWALIGTSGMAIHEPRTTAFLAGCLALAPFHTGIATGNQTILVVGLCSLGIWAAGAECDLLAGVLFGIACSLKPHIGAFLVLYYLVQRRWRLLLTAVAFTAALTLVAIAWMQFAGVDWFAGYASNIRLAAAKNTIDDFTNANPIRFMLINLQVLVYSFTHSARSANLVAFSLGGMMILAWTILVIRNKDIESRLLALSAISVIGLLPLYHRFYDAAVLAIPLCWCLNRPDHLKRIAHAALLLMVPFLIPGTAVLQQAARQKHVPEAWTHTWLWNDLLMPHQTWLLVLLCLVLLYGMAHERGAGYDVLT